MFAATTGANKRSASNITSSPLVWPRSTNSTNPGHAHAVRDKDESISASAR